MLNIEFYITSGFFQLKEFNPGEIVFDEGSNDENLYIIISGKIGVGKYTTTEKKEVKELALLRDNDFFGEASLNSNIPKEAVLRAVEYTKLIYINGKIGLQNFIEKYPKEGFELLLYIIDSTNKRLVLANKLITANHEIVKSIIEIEDINDKSIFLVIDKIKLVTGYDYILYFEVNQVVNDFLLFKYDTRQNGKFQDKVIERIKFNDLKNFKDVVLENYNYVQKLNIGKIDLGFLIIGKKSSLDYEDRKLILSISNSLTGLIRQKAILKDELNKKSAEEG